MNNAQTQHTADHATSFVDANANGANLTREHFRRIVQNCTREDMKVITEDRKLRNRGNDASDLSAKGSRLSEMRKENLKLKRLKCSVKMDKLSQRKLSPAEEEEIMRVHRSSVEKGRVTSMGGGVMHMSAKDILPVFNLLHMAIPEGMESRQALIDAGEPPRQDDPVREYLWEAALKIRIEAAQAKAAIDAQVFQRCERPFKANFFGGWEKFQIAKYSDERKGTADFCTAIGDAELSMSVVHEVVRYRSGCVALARHPTCLMNMLSIPFEKIINICGLNGLSCGMLEQAFLDTLGRCINGLDQHPDLRASVCATVSESLETPSMMACHVAVTTMDSNSNAAPTSKPGYCINIKKTLKALTKLLNGGEKAWRSTYFMDRTMHAMFPPKSQQAGPALGDRTCHICMVRGKVGDVVKFCKRCKTVVYCSRACQLKDWKSHKTECVKQKGVKSGATPMGGETMGR